MQEANSTRNWHKYNKALQQRGAITFWIDRACLRSWYMDKPEKASKGRPQTYSDAAVQCMLIVKYIYKQSLRATQGLIDSLGLPVKAMSYTQLCRRQKKVAIPKLPKTKGKLNVAIDGTGLKLYGEGEWKVRCHGAEKRRDWMKLHIGVNVETQEIVCEHLTDNHCSEHHQLNTLLNQCANNYEVAEVLTDAGYDYHESYRIIEKFGARPIIDPNCNPRHKPKKLSKLRSDKPRDYLRWLQEQIGVKQWKLLTGYHRRSLVETAFYRLKQLLNDKLNARSFKRQQIEVSIKCHILNKLTALGILSNL